MMVSDLVNVRYLTGFTGSNGALALTDEDTFLVTDGRYLEQAAAEAPDVRVVTGRAAADVAVRELPAVGGVAVEADHVTLADYERLTAVAQAPLRPTVGLVAGLRRRKDAGEVSLIRRACGIIDAVLAELTCEIEPGQTEREIARRLYWLVQEHGGDDVAFDTIVATGPHSAIPHHSPTDRPVAAGDLLKIDAGALYRGYHSDITRTFVVGAEPSRDQVALYDAVAAAAAAARDVTRAGTPGSVADAAARDQLATAGFADRFSHGLGHGVGLQIHEAPMLGREQTDTMEAGDVLTIEPGAYIPGFGGVRVEDTLALTEDGTECLTTAARELIRLG